MRIRHKKELALRPAHWVYRLLFPFVSSWLNTEAASFFASDWVAFLLPDRIFPANEEVVSLLCFFVIRYNLLSGEPGSLSKILIISARCLNELWQYSVWVLPNKLEVDRVNRAWGDRQNCLTLYCLSAADPAWLLLFISFLRFRFEQYVNKTDCNAASGFVTKGMFCMCSSSKKWRTSNNLRFVTS